MKEILHVKGMHCPHCEAKVTKKVTELNGVQACVANHEKEMVEVDYDSTAIDLKTIKEVIDKCGFKVC